jgi:hypothetical protein
MSGLFLVAAAVAFWIAWLLMPGVGVTDPARIFELVGSQRELVATSVVVQLLSAALYVPALVGLLTGGPASRPASMRWGAGLLLTGAMGSAADAVLHLLAFAMTAPGIDSASLVPVMAFMQGPGLLMLAPLLASFFAGGWLLSLASARARVVPRWNVWLYPIAFAVAIAGGRLAAAGLVEGRLVGLAMLGLVSAAQAWVGAAWWAELPDSPSDAADRTMGAHASETS